MRMSNAKKLLKWEGVGLWNLTLVIEARKGTLTSLGAVVAGGHEY